MNLTYTYWPGWRGSFLQRQLLTNPCPLNLAPTSSSERGQGLGNRKTWFGVRSLRGRGKKKSSKQRPQVPHSPQGSGLLEKISIFWNNWANQISAESIFRVLWKESNFYQIYMFLHSYLTLLEAMYNLQLASVLVCILPEANNEKNMWVQSLFSRNNPKWVDGVGKQRGTGR